MHFPGTFRCSDTGILTYLAAFCSDYDPSSAQAQKAAISHHADTRPRPIKRLNIKHYVIH